MKNNYIKMNLMKKRKKATTTQFYQNLPYNKFISNNKV